MLKKLGVEFVDIKEFNCCGYPLKNSNYEAYVLSSARNLALAEKRDLHMMTFCNCCYISEKNVSRMMKEDSSMREDVNKTLGKEDLLYEGRTEVRHLLDILYRIQKFRFVTIKKADLSFCVANLLLYICRVGVRSKHSKPCVREL